MARDPTPATPKRTRDSTGRHNRVCAAVHRHVSAGVASAWHRVWGLSRSRAAFGGLLLFGACRGSGFLRSTERPIWPNASSLCGAFALFYVGLSLFVLASIGCALSP